MSAILRLKIPIYVIRLHQPEKESVCNHTSLQIHYEERRFFEKCCVS